LATLLGATSIVKLLHERGAEIVTNSKGFTPVDISDDPEMGKIFAQ
jgi:hypothetical protein